MESGWFVVIGAFVGAIIGAIPTIVIGKKQLEAEKEKQLRQLALEIALAEYKIEAERFEAGRTLALYSPIAHIVSANTAVTKFMAEGIKTEDVEAISNEYKSIDSEVKKHFKKASRKSRV